MVRDKLPGAQGLFSHMKEALCHVKDKRITLMRGIHEALEDFRWMVNDLAISPMRIYELVPLVPTVEGYHDALGTMCGGVVLPGPIAVPQVLPPQPSSARPSPNSTGAHLIVWWESFPPNLVDRLVTWSNPTSTVTNFEFQLPGASFNTTVQSAALTCGSTKPSPARIRCPCYIPCHDFVSGYLNKISDLPSCSTHLTDAQLLAHFDQHFPQPLPCRMRNPQTLSVSCVLSALRQTRW